MKKKIIALLIVLVVIISTMNIPASAEISAQYTLVNPGFDSNGISGWSTYNTVNATTSPVQSGSGSAQMITDSTRVSAAMWQVINIGAGSPQVGEQVEANAWIYIDPTCDLNAGATYIQVESVNSSGVKTSIAKSPNLDNTYAKGTWILLKTVYNLNAGAILADATSIVLSVQHNARGKIIVDSFSIGKAKAAATGEVALPNNSFELNNSSLSNWSTYGTVSVNTNNAYSYYGKNSAKFTISSGQTTSIWQTINIGTGDSDPKAGQAIEAGVWVYFNTDVNLSSGNCFVQIESRSASGVNTIIAKSPAVSSSTPKGRWIYLKTQSQNGGAILPGAVSIVVSAQCSFTGSTYVDFCQVGKVGIINGNPVRYAISVYEPWFGNATDGWYNWAWTDPGNSAYSHNPNTILGNGQRDIASVFYPIIGAYDSLDSNVLNYQFDIAKAALIDCFMVNDYGPTLKPRFRQVEDKMIDFAEAKDMKFSVQYEVKMHFNGWISYPAGATRQDRINGVQADLKNILDRYGNRKGFLKYNDQAVLGIFEMYQMTDTEWQGVVNNLRGMGYKLILMGDNAPTDSTPPATYYNSFTSQYNWHFIDPALYPSNNPTYNTAYAFAQKQNNAVKTWAAADTNRFGVGVVCPGFNDTGVNGWGSGSRVTSYINGQQFDASANTVRDSGLNWIMVATFNDWNEGTIIEPTKQNGYTYLIKTQNFLEAWKGVPAVQDSQMQSITEAYLGNPNVIKYR